MVQPDTVPHPHFLDLQTNELFTILACGIEEPSQPRLGRFVNQISMMDL